MNAYEALAIIVFDIIIITMLMRISYVLETGKAKPPVYSYGKRVLESTVKKIKNLGGKRDVIPDVNAALEMAFADWIRAQVRKNADLNFSESYLKDHMSEFGCCNMPTLRQLLQRFEDIGVLTRKNPEAENSTRVLALGGYTHLPISTSSTAKARQRGV